MACHHAISSACDESAVHAATPPTKKMSVSDTKESMGRTAVAAEAACGLNVYWPRRPIRRPIVTTVRMPETPAPSSASAKQPYTATMSTATSTRTSFSTKVSQPTTA